MLLPKTHRGMVSSSVNVTQFNERGPEITIFISGCNYYREGWGGKMLELKKGSK